MSDSGGSGGSDVGEEGQRPKVAPAVEKKEQQAEKQVRVPLWDMVLDLVIVLVHCEEGQAGMFVWKYYCW